MQSMLRRVRNNRGFTLIELVVVLLVLVGLSGVLIPLATNFVQRTHGATGSSNFEEITKAITRFEVESFQQPAGFDTLVDGAAGGGVFGPLPNAAAELVAEAGVALADARRQALIAAGITTLQGMNDSTAAAFENATFGATTGAAAVDLTAAGAVDLVFATGAAVSRELGVSANPDGDAGTNDYVAFGFGTSTTAIGRTAVGAPLHFLEGANPADEYARFIVIYQVTGVESARFIGVLAADEAGLVGLNGHLSEYYESVAQN